MQVITRYRQLIEKTETYVESLTASEQGIFCGLLILGAYAVTFHGALIGLILMAGAVYITTKHRGKQNNES